LSSEPAAIDGLDAAIRPTIQAAIAATGGEITRVVRTGSFADPAIAPDQVHDLTTFSSFDGIEAHATLVEGAWPHAGADPLETTLSEAAAAAFGKIYCFGPTFRAEKSKTRRHLTEFWMVEPEVAFNDSDDNMRLQEEFVSYIVARVLERRQPELKELERDVSRLEKIRAPFPRIDYSDAVKILQAKGSSVKWGDDLGAEDESLLVEGQDTPVFIYNYPKQAKAFYMKENPADPRTVLCDDLLAPEGYGEIIGGSQREDNHDRLLARIKEEGLPVDAYNWYLDLRKYGTFVHSGFGLGLERTVGWICGIHHIREAIAFPRTMNRLRP